MDCIYVSNCFTNRLGRRNCRAGKNDKLVLNFLATEGYINIEAAEKFRMECGTHYPKASKLAKDADMGAESRAWIHHTQRALKQLYIS
ncbi:hypothetical protein GQ457_07G028930 [Hibiscus cannabinus]